jgi:8-oxo-dGTP pyrophosphatase MutT (NUDIX family)
MSDEQDKTFSEGYTSGYWAGPCGIASGILPFCPASGRFCLAARSHLVHQGGCWSTIGGACPLWEAPCTSALRELREETCYEGEVKTQFLYCFRSKEFRYFTYLGVVESEFDLPRDRTSCWETTRLHWLSLTAIQQAIKTTPQRLHPGFVVMLEHSSKKLFPIVSLGRSYTGVTQPML